MADLWFYDAQGRLHFVYRARKWDENPVRYMNATEITAVVATAVDEGGLAVASTVPAYSAPHFGYKAYIDAAALLGRRMVSITLTPTMAVGINPEWAPPKTFDVTIGYPPGDTPRLVT